MASNGTLEKLRLRNVLVTLKPLMKYWFSATDEPPNEARLPKAASPRTVPGASSATEVASRATGIRAICSAVRMVVDSTEETSIRLTACGAGGRAGGRRGGRVGR